MGLARISNWQHLRGWEAASDASVDLRFLFKARKPHQNLHPELEATATTDETESHWTEDDATQNLYHLCVCVCIYTQATCHVAFSTRQKLATTGSISVQTHTHTHMREI